MLRVRIERIPVYRHAGAADGHGYQRFKTLPFNAPFCDLPIVTYIRDPLENETIAYYA